MSKLAYSFLHLPQRVEILFLKYESRSEKILRPCFTLVKNPPKWVKESKGDGRCAWNFPLSICRRSSGWKEDICTLPCFSSKHQRFKTLYPTGHWILLKPWEEVLETLFKNLQVNAVFTQTPHFSAVKNWPVLKWNDLENVFWEERIVTLFQFKLCDGTHSIFSIFFSE